MNGFKGGTNPSILTKVIAMLLIISLVINIFLALSLYAEKIDYENRIRSLVEEYNELVEENKNLKRQVSVLKKTLEMLISQQTRQQEVTSLEGYDWIPIVGVFIKSVGFFEEEVAGIVMRAHIKLVPGSGRVFISTNPKIGIDLQKAAETAYNVALKYAGVKGNYDVMIVITANVTVNVVDGPSAGGALTVLMTALLTNKTIRKDVVMTGTIMSDGSIGPVGGIYEKAIAAAEYGAKVFLVPKGQSKIYILKPEVIKVLPGVKIIRYKRVKIDLEEELRKQGYNISVYEVSTLQEALTYFLKTG